MEEREASVPIDLQTDQLSFRPHASRLYCNIELATDQLIHSHMIPKVSLLSQWTSIPGPGSQHIWDP